MSDGIGYFVKERGSPLELLAKLQQKDSKFMDNNGSVEAVVKDLEIRFKALDKTKCINEIVFDLSLARGTKPFSRGLHRLNGNKQAPAVGISIGIERIFAIMEQLQKDQNQVVGATETQVLVGFLGDDLLQAAELVSEFWGGAESRLLGQEKGEKHTDYAKESNVPFMVLVGERDVSEGVVKLKDIDTAEEEVVLRTQLIVELKKRSL